MATRQVTTAPEHSQSNNRQLSLRQDHFDALIGFEEIAGVDAQKLLDEAVQDFIQVVIAARAESLLKQAKRRQREEARAEQRQVDACLASLERQFSI